MSLAIVKQYFQYPGVALLSNYTDRFTSTVG